MMGRGREGEGNAGGEGNIKVEWSDKRRGEEKADERVGRR